jgi:hypothetical protein
MMYRKMLWSVNTRRLAVFNMLGWACSRTKPSNEELFATRGQTMGEKKALWYVVDTRLRLHRLHVPGAIRRIACLPFLRIKIFNKMVVLDIPGTIKKYVMFARDSIHLPRALLCVGMQHEGKANTNVALSEAGWIVGYNS